MWNLKSVTNRSSWCAPRRDCGLFSTPVATGERGSFAGRGASVSSAVPSTPGVGISMGPSSSRPTRRTSSFVRRPSFVFRSARSTPGAVGSSSTWTWRLSHSSTSWLPCRSVWLGSKSSRCELPWSKRIILPGNWKTSLDAFIESWHVVGTHPQLLRPDRKQLTPATIAEAESNGKTYNELFRYHSRHADFARYGPDGNPGRPGAKFRAVDADAILANVEYNLRELRAMYLKTDLLAAEELVASETRDAARYVELTKKHARAVGIDIPDLSMDQLRSGMYDWHLFPNTVFLIGNGSVLAYRARPNGADPDTCIFDVQGLELPPAAGITTAPPSSSRTGVTVTSARSSVRTSPT